ncbi:hypothetical protein MMC26_007390 [Xylographa opegraphella]|nr:hypothetical protein [Xylographa opegraphella]
MVAMTHRPLRKSQLIAFDHAAAGHEGILSDVSGEVLAKPCKQAEIDFYESTTAHPDFAYYIPVHCGTLSLGQSRDIPEAAAVLPSSLNADHDAAKDHLESATATGVLEPWVPSNGGKLNTDCAIVLENVAAGLRKPNILDVKLGARLWADDAPPAKRQKLDDMSQITTSKPLGFRIAGMKTWMGVKAAGLSHVSPDGYKIYDRKYGRSLTPETVREGFENYFFIESAGITKKFARRLIKRFLGALRGLQEVLEKEESRMYSASLLFVYEGDGAGLQADFETEKQVLDLETEHQLLALATPPDGALPNASPDRTVLETEANIEDEDYDDDDDDEGVGNLPKIQALKMIDFAHASWTPGMGPDENVLHGIRNVISILEDLLT